MISDFEERLRNADIDIPASLSPENIRARINEKYPDGPDDRAYIDVPVMKKQSSYHMAAMIAAAAAICLISFGIGRMTGIRASYDNMAESASVDGSYIDAGETETSFYDNQSMAEQSFADEDYEKTAAAEAAVSESVSSENSDAEDQDILITDGDYIYQYSSLALTLTVYRLNDGRSIELSKTDLKGYPYTPYDMELSGDELIISFKDEQGDAQSVTVDISDRECPIIR